MAHSAIAQENLTKVRRHSLVLLETHDMHDDQDEAQHLVEELRRRQNEDLLLVLEREQSNETEREIELTKAPSSQCSAAC